MPEPYTVKPDSEFIHRILEEGGEDVKKCYQCATCSVVCDLSGESNPFPRKEMIWTQWGLKDRLMADPDVWLCHQCNDCSTRCPRGARPGDVLSAIRHQAVVHYAVPRSLAVLVNSIKNLPLLTVVPVVLLALALAVREPLGKMLPFEEHEGALYAEFFPHWLLIAFFSTFTGLAFLGAAAGIFRFWRAMKAADSRTPVLGIVPSVVRTLQVIFVHDRFGKCTAESSRKLNHILAFYGFVALFVVTIYAVIDLYVFPHVRGVDSAYPFNLMHPMKMLANVGCVMLIAGCVRAMLERTREGNDAAAGSFFDWVFVSLLLGVGVTGLATEVVRFAIEPVGETTVEHTRTDETGAAGLEGLEGTEGAAGLGADAAEPAHDPHVAEQGATTSGEYLAFAIYFVHLVLVFELLVYLPYSKFAHIMYRTVAMVYAEHTGRTGCAATTA